MKKITNKILGFLFAGLLLASCDKVEKFEPLNDDGQKIIKVFTYGGSMGDGFSQSALVFDGSSTFESVEFRFEYSGPRVFDQDVVLTIGVDPTAITTYNAALPPGATPYEEMPASFYNLPVTTATIKAGEIYSEPVEITFNPSLFDAAINYMVPVTILSISGAPADVKKAPNTGTAFFHVIGNPLAGSYDVEGYFYHPSSPRDLMGVKDMLPLTSTTLEVELGDLGGSGYYAAVTTDPATNEVTIEAAPGAAGGPYTMFSAGLPSSNPGYTAGWARSAECDNTYDPATKTFKLRYGYMGANGWRVTEEILVKQ